MKQNKNEGLPLTGTPEQKEDQNEAGFDIFQPIQQMWRINPTDKKDDRGTVGYKER